MEKKIFIKKDVFLPILKEYGFKEQKTEKKNCYTGNGFEVDIETRELKSTSKSDLVLLIKMLFDNIIEVVVYDKQ